jgi:hypothetical protein
MDPVFIIEYTPFAGQARPLEYQGKFLQLVLRAQEYLVFAPAEIHRYHNQILAHFLEDNSIPCKWLSREELEVKSPDLAVLGGGRFRVNTEKKTLDLWDNSQAYGRFREHGLRDGIATASHAWSNYEIRIT